MDTIPSLGARPSIKDPRTVQHSNLKTLAGVPNIKGGHSYLPSDIEHQRNVGICFVGDTLIQMADASFKEIRNIQIGDEVIDAYGNKQIVQNTMSRLWQGNLYSIKPSGCDVETICTPEHPFLMSDGSFRPAKELTKNDYICMPSIKEIKDKTDFWYESDNRFLRLLGLYLAEGSTEISGKKSGRVTFTLNIKEKYLAEFITQTVMELFGLTTRVYEKQEVHTLVVRISSRYLVDIFDSLASKYSQGKIIHKKLLLLDPKKQLEIFRGWASGDGSTRGEKFYGVSISKSLVKQMYQILIRNGIACRLRTRKAYNNGTPHQEALELVINQTNAHTIFPQINQVNFQGGNTRVYLQDGMVVSKIMKIEKLQPHKHIQGGITVYNIETTGTHTYTANFIAVHNCTAISIVQAAEKFYRRKFSPEFQYLMQKKFMDKNWGEGSSILSALKTAKKFGFLPLEDFPYVTEQDRDLSYSVYIKKLWDIPQAELDRLYTISKNYSLAGYASVGIDPTALANAIATSQVGILTRYEVGSEWWMATDGRISWSSTDINPLRPPTSETFASGHAIIMSSYDFTTNNWTILANTWSKDWNKQGLADVLLGYYNPTEAWVPYFVLQPDQDEELKQELTKKISLLQQIVFLLRKAIELQNKLKGVKHL